jgi:hypothetical protein
MKFSIMRNPILLLFILLIVGLDSYSQTKEQYCPFNFSSDKYSSTYDSVSINDYYITVLIKTPFNQKKEKHVWIVTVNREIKQYYESDTIGFNVEDFEYVGSLDHNGTIYVPRFQLLKDIPIIVFDGNKTKKVILFKGSDMRVLLGNRFAITSDSLALYSNSEDSELIYRYNIKLDRIAIIRTLPKNLNLNYYIFRPEDKL